MSERIICDLCRNELEVHASYIVRIEVFADPTMPQMSKEELHSLDFEAAMEDLLDQMKSMTAEELQDAVHRKFEFRLCRPCHAKFLANPLGKPRVSRAGTN